MGHLVPLSSRPTWQRYSQRLWALFYQSLPWLRALSARLLRRSRQMSSVIWSEIDSRCLRRATWTLCPALFSKYFSLVGTVVSDSLDLSHMFSVLDIEAMAWSVCHTTLVGVFGSAFWIYTSWWSLQKSGLFCNRSINLPNTACRMCFPESNGQPVIDRESPDLLLAGRWVSCLPFDTWHSIARMCLISGILFPRTFPALPVSKYLSTCLSAVTASAFFESQLNMTYFIPLEATVWFNSYELRVAARKSGEIVSSTMSRIATIITRYTGYMTSRVAIS